MSSAPHSHGQDLLSFLHALSVREIPADVLDRARACLRDALGCGIFGSGEEWSRILGDEVTEEGSRGTCTVIGRAERVSAPAAALCNGTAIHGFELDDLIAESIVHPGACVIPAAIAAGEASGAPGARVLEGILAGYEAMHRVGVAMGVEPARRGFHTTSLVAPVACAVAAGKASGLSLERLRSAVGLACSAASGIKSFAAGHGGGMVKRLHLGRAAEAGVRSAQLAARDFLGPPHALDSRFGLLEVYGGSGAQAERMSRALGREWALRDVWFKVYPICGWIQPVVQLLQEGRGPRTLSPDDVKQVEVGVSRYAAQNNGEPAPIDTMGAQYSIPYCAAVALLADPRDPASFRTEAVNDPRTRSLAARVKIVVDPQIEAVYPGKFGARVRLELVGGTPFERSVLECHGTPADPCSDAELTDKFRRLAGTRLPPRAVSDLAALVDDIADLRCAPDLMKPFHTAESFTRFDRRTA